MLPAVLLAGGAGTRVAGLSADRLPKAMLTVAGRPFIDFKIADLAAQGVDDVFLLVAHRAEPLRAHVGDGGGYGTRVHVIDEGVRLLGTAGAVRRALPQLPPAFFLSYADTFLPVELAPVEAAFRAATRRGLMTVLENHDRWQRSNVRLVGDLVVAYEKGGPPGACTHLDYGLLAFDASAFATFPYGATVDLAAVFDALVAEHDLTAFVVHERFHDIGTPEALVETERALRELELERRLAPHLP